MKKLWSFFVIIFALAITYMVWPKLVTEPGNILLDLGGDGAKNYFTFLYHSVYGNGFHFTGMNYPYGEHIVYTDAQPLISVSLATIRKYVPVTMKDAVITLHTLLILSFFLAILFNYAILRQFKVNNVLALLFASLITICSPQIYRVFGHFGLAYFCIIPMVFFFTIRYHKTGKIWYPLLLLFTSLVVSFVHPYFGAVVLIWSLIYSTGYYIFSKNRPTKKTRHVLPLLVAVIIAFVSVQVIMKLTDTVTDRPVTPFGVSGNGTTGRDIFFSSLSLITGWIDASFSDSNLPGYREGYTYIGFANILVIIIAIIFGIRNRKKKTIPAERLISEENFSPVWLFISIATLLLGMGVPFVWNMQWLLDYVPAFKQFRSMGRFSWMFYYSITIFSAVAINHWFYKTKQLRKKLAITGLIAVLAVWTIDAVGYVNFARERTEYANYYHESFFTEHNWPGFLAGHNYNRDSFQAILMLPYFHVGTEKFSMGAGTADWAMTLSMRTAVQLHLPLVDVMMSRSSWSQATSQARLFGGPLTDKPLLNAGKKPFLTMVYAYPAVDIDRNTEYILNAADYIDSFAYFKVYALYPERLAALDKHIADSIAAPYKTMVGRDTCISCDKQYFINHFDTGQSGIKFHGSASTKVIEDETAYAAEFSFDTSLNKETEYEFSVWIRVREEDYKMPYFVLDVFDDKDSILVRHRVELKPVDSYRLWYRMAKYINLPEGTKYVKCMAVNFDGPTYAAMDELVLKPSAVTVISKLESGTVMVNNHVYKR